MTGRGFTAAADILGVTETWLRANSTRLPRHKYGKTVLFTDDDLAAIAAMHQQRPTETPSLPVAVTALEDLKPSTARRRRAS